ncbi:MAG: hypothetical protein R3A48_01075 [Polyangiales bacterium]
MASDEVRLRINDNYVVSVSETNIRLSAVGGASIVIDDSGITLDNGKGAKLTLKGPTVDVNDGALTVT